MSDDHVHRAQAWSHSNTVMPHRAISQDDGRALFIFRRKVYRMRKYTSLLALVLILFAVAFPPITLATQAQSAPAWQPNTSYAVGAIVTYGGSTYKCIQAHTSQVGW